MDKKHHIELCEQSLTEEDCLNLGCKSWRKNKCKANKKNLKCSKVGKAIEVQYKQTKDTDAKAQLLEDKEAYCDIYAKYPGNDNHCTWKTSKKGGKCSGTIKF